MWWFFPETIYITQLCYMKRAVPSYFISFQHELQIILSRFLGVHAVDFFVFLRRNTNDPVEKPLIFKAIQFFPLGRQSPWSKNSPLRWRLWVILAAKELRGRCDLESFVISLEYFQNFLNIWTSESKGSLESYHNIWNPTRIFETFGIFPRFYGYS